MLNASEPTKPSIVAYSIVTLQSQCLTRPVAVSQALIRRWQKWWTMRRKISMIRITSWCLRPSLPQDGKLLRKISSREYARIALKTCLGCKEHSKQGLSNQRQRIIQTKCFLWSTIIWWWQVESTKISCLVYRPISKLLREEGRFCTILKLRKNLISQWRTSFKLWDNVTANQQSMQEIWVSKPTKPNKCLL